MKQPTESEKNLQQLEAELNEKRQQLQESRVADFQKKFREVCRETGIDLTAVVRYNPETGVPFVQWGFAEYVEQLNAKPET